MVTAQERKRLHQICRGGVWLDTSDGILLKKHATLAGNIILESSKPKDSPNSPSTDNSRKQQRTGTKSTKLHKAQNA